MKRAWAAAITGLVAVGAVAVAFAVTAGSGSGSALGLAYVVGTIGATPSVWFADADGRHGRRLGHGTRPLLAPNGSLVAASCGRGLVLYPTSGAAPHRYFRDPNATAVAAACSPDSRYIAVVLSSPDPASAAFSGLAVINTASFGYRILVRGQIYGASFARGRSDRIAYASAASPALSSPVNVHIIGAHGSTPTQITHDGRSLNPVWGPRGIAFDHKRLRPDAEPAFQLWLMAGDGGARRPLTALAIGPLREGLVPIGFSDDRSRLLAEYEGQDTSEAWLVRLPSGHAAPLGAELAGAALSRDHASVLLDRGGFLNPPSTGVVESLPLAGGPGGRRERARILVAHGSEPSWNE